MVAFYRHVAFEHQFRRYDGVWYVELNPTYVFTSDGIALDAYHQERLAGIKRLEEFFVKIKLPVGLKDIQILEDQLPMIAANCMHSGPVGNLKKLHEKDVLEILRMAYHK